MRAFFWLIEMQKNWRRPFPGDGSERVYLVWGAPFLSLALLGLMATVPFLQPDHRLPIVAAGIFLLDSPNLAPLAETAARLNRWEFMLMISPAAATNGSGGPVNPLALF